MAKPDPAKSTYRKECRSCQGTSFTIIEDGRYYKCDSCGQKYRTDIFRFIE
jgi:tRNA(Ile2) C34 agmatinyltransferase TiaS